MTGASTLDTVGQFVICPYPEIPPPLYTIPTLAMSQAAPSRFHSVTEQDLVNLANKKSIDLKATDKTVLWAVKLFKRKCRLCKSERLKDFWPL